MPPPGRTHRRRLLTPRRLLLLFQLRPEIVLLQVEMRLVTRGIYKRIRIIWTSLLQLRILLLHAVKSPVRSKEDVNRQRPEDLEPTNIVIGNLRIVFVVDQNISRVHPNTSKDHDIVRLAIILRLRSPRSAAL